MEKNFRFIADATRIKRLGLKAALSAFQHWINEIAVWLAETFSETGYAAEWLSLDAGPSQNTRSIKGQPLHKSLEKAVDERVAWLVKLEKISLPKNNK